jgi:membrane protease YdiL (CAAX protease family)
MATGSTVVAEKRNAGTAIARNVKLRLLVVMGVVVSLYGLLFLVLQLAKLAGIDPSRYSGFDFDITLVTLILFFLFYGLHVLGIFTAQRYLHQRRISELGFTAPVISHLLTGFLGGLLFGSVKRAVAILAAESVEIQWSIPEEISALTVIGYYLFFFVYLTANSFGEELVFRSYPVEQFRDSRKGMICAAVGSTLIFTAIHFVFGTFDLAWMVRIAGFALLTFYLYIHWKSIWLIIGFHNGVNFAVFSISGKWKTGGILNVTWTPPDPVIFASIEAGTALGALYLIHLYRSHHIPSESWRGCRDEDLSA